MGSVLILFVVLVIGGIYCIVDIFQDRKEYIKYLEFYDKIRLLDNIEIVKYEPITSLKPTKYKIEILGKGDENIRYNRIYGDKITCHVINREDFYYEEYRWIKEEEI